MTGGPILAAVGCGVGDWYTRAPATARRGWLWAQLAIRHALWAPQGSTARVAVPQALAVVHLPLPSAAAAHALPLAGGACFLTCPRCAAGPAVSGAACVALRPRLPGWAPRIFPAARCHGQRAGLQAAQRGRRIRSANVLADEFAVRRHWRRDAPYDHRRSAAEVHADGGDAAGGAKPALSFGSLCFLCAAWALLCAAIPAGVLPVAPSY